MNEFGNRLKDLRESKRWTKVYVADQLNLPTSTYANYEYGTREPNLELSSKIAALFGVSTDYLLTGKKNAPIDLKKADVLSYDGKPVSDEDLAIIRAILERNK